MNIDKQIASTIPLLLKSITVPGFGKKYNGKVRDFYIMDNKRILITTDRQSAFDVNLGYVPYKGTILTMLTAFWFEKCRDIISSHMIAVPDPNVMIGKNCQAIPIEMIIRGYITGSTNTSIWYSYKQGERLIYGLHFPEGLKKNQKLHRPVITPTTHGGGKSGHDDRMTREEILNSSIVSKKLYKQMEEITFALYERGSQIAEKAGFIMPDTKYEFGIYEDKLILIDELHTPDGSRFWLKDTYDTLFDKGKEPENFDKEFIRLWYTQRINPYKDTIPSMPKKLMIEASKRYLTVYEEIIGKKFTTFFYPIEDRIVENIQNYFNNTKN